MQPFPAAGVVTEPGKMVIHSWYQFCPHDPFQIEEFRVPGMVAEWSEDANRAGLHIGYEAGQASGGDHFAWFMKNGVPARIYEREARKRQD